MLSAICFNLDQSKILSSGNGLNIQTEQLHDTGREAFSACNDDYTPNQMHDK